jgi:hypothetical protein
MPSRVLYRIPLAAGPARLVMAAACLLLVATICGWWLPRAIRRLRGLRERSRAQAAFGVAAVVIPAAIAVWPLALLIALVRNPEATVTDAGVAKESVFQRAPTRFGWDEIAEVFCRSETAGAIESIVVVARDGRRIELGNTGGVDFASLYELFGNQLGPGVVKPCDALRGQAR